ncbi:hypothetical protein FQA39_LY03413 [Lamprigera yunnana]|nr:hypothetical protein FQA39_LY03413 [Lamprigera yunnana]
MEEQNENVEEEYICSMRIHANQEDSETWKDRKLASLQPGSSTNPNQRRKSIAKNISRSQEDHVTEVLASLVPDEIIYNVNDYSNRPYNACFLLGDVSGFTQLSEAYNQTGKGGASRLTCVLNNYIGSMVQDILAHNGDILKFSGDAFLAMWKCSVDNIMQDVVHAAVDSAIAIQKLLGSYEKDGVVLKVKLAISAGFVIFSVIGNAEMSHYVCIGQPISDVKLAEKMTSAGEIIVSNSAWNYLNPNEYVWETCDGHHTKVLPHSYFTNRRYQRKRWPKNRRFSFSSPKDDIDYRFDLQADQRRSGSLELYSRPPPPSKERPSVKYASKVKLKVDLEKYIIPPIMMGIDLGQPLEYLTEMRQIVIVFINTIIDQKMGLPLQIELIDTIYKKVCSLALEHDGCVNKLSAFDKDLMFVLLFGLRGSKSELESQMGLKCASECFQTISQLNVLSVSAGVTTGMTYCGVVGHTFRREYTVISVTVNKAARLMMAYPDKVTCDRETFLQSKLESKNFILQEHKPLKGIVNVGPIYEYKEQIGTQGKIAINPFPLLGRLHQVTLYKQLLEENIKISRERGKNQGLQLSNSYRAMVIQGDLQMGKTRLLDEFVYCTPPTIPVNRFTLLKKDEKLPYETTQKILSTPLGLTQVNTPNDRANKLKLRLQKLNSKWHCALNKVFNVDFDISSSYKTLSNQNKMEVLQKLLKHLCYIGFITLWVVAIDNAEFIDVESWTFINELLQLDLAFVVMTMTTTNRLHDKGVDIFNNSRIKKLQLEPLDKCYQAGLACQILNVRAIPPEIEKLIQAKSNGNPGWIESFLISLMQTGWLQVQQMTKADINEGGLVKPPLEMLTRYNLYFLLNNFSIVRNSFRMVDSKEKSHKTNVCSSTDSVTNLLKEKVREQHDLKAQLQVCVLAPNFKLEEVDAESYMDAVVIKLFDSLASFEQLLLKCSSVLGEYFPRKMLLNILASPAPRRTAFAIQKLYELRVLGCAQGDFTHEDGGMIFGFLNPNQDVEIKCYCKGLKIHEMCLDLPKYASCGFLHFRQSTFRKTTYNLLTDNQKREFHSRAIRFLERETRRCRSCGNGPFLKILGNKYDEGFVKLRDMKKQDVLQLKYHNMKGSTDFKEVSRELTQASFQEMNISIRGLSSRFKSISDSATQLQMHIKLIVERFFNQHWTNFGFVNNIKRSISLTKTFSYADFTTCQCQAILNTMYTQMLKHCKGAGQLDKLMNAMLEYSYICITSHNIPQAMKILKEASDIVHELDAKKVELDQEAQWKIPLTKGKIDSLYCHAYLELGQIEEAYTYIIRTLKYYGKLRFAIVFPLMKILGYSFPSTKIKIKLNIFLNELKQRLGMYAFPTLFVSTIEEYEAEFYDDVSECLSLMCNIFMDLHMWDHAELAACWSLTKSLESDSDFFGLCRAYTNMITVTHHLGKEHLSVALEVHGLCLCHRKHSTIEAHELKAVCQLYKTIFTSRLLRSELEHSINIGYTMLRAAATIPAVQILLSALPLMIQVLLLRRKISEAVTSLLELEYYSEEDTDISGKTWFHALSVELQIETGYALLSFQKSERFYKIEEDALKHIRNSDAEKRFYVVMWLWYVRNEDWEAATVWYLKIQNFRTTYAVESLNDLFTSLYFFEGLLIYLVEKINRRNIQAITEIHNEIYSLCRIMDNACKIIKVIIPRYLHLKAYFKYIQNLETKAFQLLEKAKGFALKYGNELELAWIGHSKKAWSHNLSVVLLNYWKKHCQGDNSLDYDEEELNEGKLGLYTLPTPKYY